jgi:hypothetical protein
MTVKRWAAVFWVKPLGSYALAASEQHFLLSNLSVSQELEPT